MSEAFLKVVNMSISAGWLVLAVLALRLILKKAPNWVNVLLWGIVAIRLICPFSIESALSLIPSTETISPEIMMDWTPEISTGIEPLDQVVNPVISTSFAPQGMASANPLQILIPVAANLWLLGVLILLAYTAISYLTLRNKLRTAVILRDNIFQCETVSSPFVLGILKPRIYLPYTMDGKYLSHVVAHEKAHIRRKDHWWKPLGFLLMTVYWFNPLMWVAYILLCRDIELACDEKVIAELENDQRADYTQALVTCAVNRRMIAACPLAFGEVGVKDRVKSIMNYRKPTFWIIVTALVVCVVVAVCFLTDPNPSREFSMNGNNVSGLDPKAIVERIMDIESIDNSNVYVNTSNFPIQVDSEFNWANSQTVAYFFWKNGKSQSSQLRIYPEEDQYFLTEPEEWPEQQEIFLLRHYLDALKYLPQYEIQQMAPADQYIIQHVAQGRPSDYDRVISYSSDGVQETDGWYIHLRIEPFHETDGAYHSIGEEVIDVFYGDDVVSNAIFDSKVFAADKDDVVGTISSVESIEPLTTQNGDILILQNEGGLWHFNKGQQLDVSVVFENDGSYMSMKAIGYIFCGNGSEGLYANEIFADQNIPQSNGIFTAPETGNYLFYFRNYSSSWLTLQKFNVVYRNDLDVDRIVMLHSEEQWNPAAEATITNSEEIYHILSLYQSVQVEDYSRPLSEERIVIQFYRGEDIVQDWTVSYYAEDDTVVTCSDRFGLGNRRVTSDFSYDMLLRLFEEHAYTFIPAYEPLGVSGNNVEELSRMSDHVKWIDGLGMDELEPGEEIVSDFVIDVEEDGTDLLIMITWGSQDLVLKYGIRAEDGPEFFQEKKGGSSMLRLKDIPAGTYRLFVRNSEAYAGIPAYENPEDFPDVSFNATGAILYAFDN